MRELLDDNEEENGKDEDDKELEKTVEDDDDDDDGEPGTADEDDVMGAVGMTTGAPSTSAYVFSVFVVVKNRFDASDDTLRPLGRFRVVVVYSTLMGAGSVVADSDTLNSDCSELRLMGAPLPTPLYAPPSLMYSVSPSR